MAEESLASPGAYSRKVTGNIRDELRGLPGIQHAPVSGTLLLNPVILNSTARKDPAVVARAEIDDIPDKARFRTKREVVVGADSEVRRDSTLGVRDGEEKNVFQLFADGQVRGTMPPVQRVSEAEQHSLVRAGVVPITAGRSDRTASSLGPASLRIGAPSVNNESRAFEVATDDPTERESRAMSPDSNEAVKGNPSTRNLVLAAGVVLVLGVGMAVFG